MAGLTDGVKNREGNFADHQRDFIGADVAIGSNSVFLLGAARPLPPSADIGPGGQSVGQPTEPCLAKLILHAAVGRVSPVLDLQCSQRPGR